VTLIWRRGSYVVNDSDNTTTFKPERATFPNWDGSEMKRSLTLSGDELKYTVAAASAGGTATVTWQRRKYAHNSRLLHCYRLAASSRVGWRLFGDATYLSSLSSAPIHP
jgi:hypothetical protein